MLREVKSARFVRRRTLLGRRYALALHGGVEELIWRRRAFDALREDADRAPVVLADDEERCWWLFEGRVYRSDDELTARDVLALVRERERRDRRRLERAHAALAADAGPLSRRVPIPRAVRQAVFERDAGRCVQCGAAFDLQYDHVIPVALGGADTAANLQLLCAPCNQLKGATL